MYSYNSLSQAVNDLSKRGYTLSFEAKKNELECSDGSLHQPDHFEIKEVYRFEGMSSASDNAVVYAIETSDHKRGTLVDSYGVYAENLTPEMAKKMSFVRS